MRYTLKSMYPAGCKKPSAALVSGTWRFTRSRGTPCAEARLSLLYQNDDARPQTAKENRRAFASQSKTKRFSLSLRGHLPSTESRRHVNDLVFFDRLQGDVSLVAKENCQELLAAVLDSLGWREDSAEKMESVWMCLHISFHSILDSSDGNDYPRHCGSCIAHRSAIKSCRAITADALPAAESTLVALSSDDSDKSSPQEATISESEESDSD